MEKMVWKSEPEGRNSPGKEPWMLGMTRKCWNWIEVTFF